jgi:hypothetical protein
MSSLGRSVSFMINACGNTYITSNKDLHLLIVEVTGNSLAHHVVAEPFYLVNSTHGLSARDVPIDFHSSLYGAMAFLAWAITYSGVALALSTRSPSVELNSTYNRVMLRSRGIHRIEPTECDRTATLLQRSGKSVSITPG